MARRTRIFGPGDRCRINDSRYPGVWVVEKVNPKNTIVSPLTGGRRLNAPHHLLVDEDAAIDFDILPVPLEYFSVGELVHWDDERADDNCVYVVIRDNRDRVNIARLGGDNDRYWRVPHRQLHRVDPDEVLK